MRAAAMTLAATAMLAMAPIGASARANVVALSDIGFAIQGGIDVAADPATVYALIATPAKWWSPAHSHSGDAANMTIDARAGGCFCEAVPARDGKAAGSVEHGRVIYAAPGRQLRLSGALGPLQSEALTGTLDFMLTPVAGGKGTKILMTYHVGGYARTPMNQLAPMVDKMLLEQLAGLQRAADAAK